MIFLTFDDGPQEFVTPWVLNQLEIHRAKATFFCVGNNLIRQKEIASTVLSKGHAIANHTVNHVKGWNTDNVVYSKEIEDTNQIIKELYDENRRVLPPRICFRPPYGRITPRQLIWLKAQQQPVIMWTLLSCDYDKNLDCAKSLRVLKKEIKAGSIVVFHDSNKAFPQLQQILPEFLQFCTEQGYSFGLLPHSNLYHP